MVVFTCGHCGESVNKPKVEKHYLTKCKNRNPNLSCMDCFKDFMGNDYAAHTKCITEEERYSGKGFTAKEKKGEKKQSAWVEMVQSVLDEQKTASKNVLRIIETISKHNNTPRKKPKFFNFVKNVCGAKTSAKDIEQAWDLISVKLSALSNNNRQEDNLKDTSNVPNGKNTNDESEKDISLNNDSVNNKENQEDSGETEEKEKEPESQTNGEANIKLSKKQKKEEKKRRKYEAELQQVEAGVETEEQEPEVPNKTKKNKNKTVENGHNDVINGEVKGKNKKRKRQDTVNTVESIEKVVVSVETDVSKVKATKKKPKTDGEIESEENLCLHDQNVAQSEIAETNGKFNWHAVIVSVLQKKGNEVPFKRLQKKVLTEYTEFTGSEVDDRIADKFIKKLKSAPNVKVDKNRVILIDE